MAASTEPVGAVLIDAETINRIDMTAANMLDKLHAELNQENVLLSLARVRDSVRTLLRDCQET